MNNTSTTSSDQQCSGSQMSEPLLSQIYDHLLGSDLFSIYRGAFEGVTQHTVALIHATIEKTPDDEINRCKNNYCSILLKHDICSDRCLEHTEDLSVRSRKRAATAQCDGKIATTLIPVHCQGSVVAYLRTGQVKMNSVGNDMGLMDELANSLPESVAEDLKEQFKNLPSYTETEYVDQLVVIGAFSLQLSELAEKLINNNDASSLLTERCKSFIQKHLTEKICLDTLAEHVKVTNSYMCKQFKKNSGLTIVEYINKHRIELAKQLLEDKRDQKVIEVAYESGFQSLSQFNRTFQRYAGVSPTAYRKKLAV